MTIKIIAEIGINHNGDIDICKKMIDVAVQSGCHAVKFQKRNIDKVYTQDFLNSFRESPWGKTQRDQKMQLEFSEYEYSEIDKYCKKLNIIWFASAWDTDSQKFLNNFNCPYNKIASAMIVDNELLELVASEKKITFISTGMSTFNEIDNAVEIFQKYNCPFELMHTVSTYPMKDEDANLSMINVLRNRYQCKVGYSGHEVGLAISYAAAALNISTLERHITLDRSMYGSEQSASVEPNGLRQLVGAVRKIEIAIGNGEKKISNEEMTVAKKLRQHLNW